MHSGLFSVAVSLSVTQEQDYDLNETSRNEIVVASEASEHVLCDKKLHSEVQQVPCVHVELPNGCSLVSNQKSIVSLQIEADETTLGLVYCTPSSNFNIMSCSKLDEKGVTRTKKNGLYQSTDCRDGVTNASIVKRANDSLLVTPLSSIGRYAANHNNVTIGRT